MARIPDSIDKYKLEELVASGGMGRVYRGVHPTLDRQVIIKKLTLRGDAAYAERFRREASILMDFRSDFIVDVYDHFRKASNHYIVMEYVDGLSVQDLLQRERYLDGALCAWITLCTAKALAYAHAKRVVHRDIKPANVLVSTEGDVKLVDFGIATSREDDSDLTSEGMTLGTPSYMAPEQFADSRTVDGRADFYSLGVMLYELLTGKKPYPGRFSPELIRTIESGRYANPRKVNPAAPRELVRIVRAVMRPNPRKRRADPDHVIARLERFLERYDEAALKARLAAVVAGEQVTPLARAKKRGGLLKAAIGVTVTLVIAALASWTGLTRLHNRLISPAEYGQARFVVEGFEGEVERRDVRIDLDGTAVRMAPLVDRARRDPESVILTSLPVVLPAGEYMATATIGDRELVAMFEVAPWQVSRAERVISMPLVDTDARPLRLETIITDGATGADLTGMARVEMLRGNRYIDIDRAGEVLSGRVLTFRIRVTGYETRTVVVEPRRGTGSLTIQASMQQSGGNE